MSVQNFTKTYTMISSSERSIIIQKINNNELVSECLTGQKQEWWMKKHHPDNEIPKNIYSLEQGSIKELYDKYITTYGGIEWEEFTNYTREMIKQNIMF